MAKFIQIDVIRDEEKENIFALDDEGRVYVTYWDKFAPEGKKWQDWIPLPRHPYAGEGDGEN